jgi:hypothetical protein
VTACRAKLVQIAVDAGVSRYDAEFIFTRNVIHGDMLFFPMIARFYEWKTKRWTTLEEMALEETRKELSKSKTKAKKTDKEKK